MDGQVAGNSPTVAARRVKTSQSPLKMHFKNVLPRAPSVCPTPAMHVRIKTVANMVHSRRLSVISTNFPP